MSSALVQYRAPKTLERAQKSRMNKVEGRGGRQLLGKMGNLKDYSYSQTFRHRFHIRQFHKLKHSAFASLVFFF
jgi:hypothetical protein